MSITDSWKKFQKWLDKGEQLDHIQATKVIFVPNTTNIPKNITERLLKKLNSKSVKVNDCLIVDYHEYYVLGFHPSEYPEVSVTNQTVVEILTVDTLKEPLLSNLKKLVPQQFPKPPEDSLGRFVLEITKKHLDLLQKSDIRLWLLYVINDEFEKEDWRMVDKLLAHAGYKLGTKGWMDYSIWQLFGLIRFLDELCIVIQIAIKTGVFECGVYEYVRSSPNSYWCVWKKIEI